MAGQTEVDMDPASKLGFDLSKLDEHGLYGPPNGLRALEYEFCIPAREDLVGHVRKIDPTLRVSRASPGRVGCSKDEYLCLGSTHQPGYRAVLLSLTQLDYVARIEQFYGE